MKTKITNLGYENFRKTVYLLYSTYAAVDLDEKLHRRPWPWPVLNLAQGGQEGCRAALRWAARAALAKKIEYNEISSFIGILQSGGII